MSDEQPSGNTGGPRVLGRRDVMIGVVLLLVVIAVALVTLPRLRQSGERLPLTPEMVESLAAKQAEAAKAATEVVPAADPTPYSAGAELRVASGRSLELSADRLALSPTVPLELGLDVESDHPTGDLEARIVAQTGDVVVESKAHVADESLRSATFEVPTQAIAAKGEYIVEVKTKERSAIPLRRYKLVVR